MSCLPSTPVSHQTYDSGYVQFGTAIHTSAMTAEDAPYAEVVTLPNVLSTTDQVAVIEQFHIRETAAGTGTAVKAPMRVYFYSTSAPTTPTAGAVYSASTTNYLGQVSVETADYQRITDGASPVYEAVIRPALYIKSSSTTTNVTSIYAVMVTTGTPTFVANDVHDLRVFVRQHEQVA